MKTLHTIYTNFAKRLALVSILLTYFGVAAAWGETLTLSDLGKNISTASNDVKTTTIVATGDNTETYTINYKQCSSQSNSGNYAMLLKRGAEPFISNKTPIPGNIKSVTIYILTGASSSTSYHCAFSTTECTSVYTTGSTAQTISGGSSKKYTCEVDNAKYFCISLGNNNNGQVWKIDVEYEVVSGSSYTVNWYVNNSLLHTQTDVVGTVLSSMPTPTKLDCDNEKVFVGWTTSAYSHATTAPSTLITNTSGMTIPEGGADYHAVFAKPNPNGTEQRTVTLSPPETANDTYKEGTQLDSENNIWTYHATINNEYGNICFGLNSNEKNYNIGSPVFGGNVTSVSFKAHNGSTTESRNFLFCSSNSTAQPQSGDLAEVTIPKGGSSFNHTIYTADLSQLNVSQFYIYVIEALRITDISVTYKCAYSNYTTNCAEIITYNVIYEANDKTSGTVPIDNNEYESGETVTVKSHGDLAKIGYTFAGWKRSDNSDIVQDNNTFTMPASDLTLTAQWTAQQYNIIYKDQGNADYSGENIADLPTSHTYDQTTTLVAGVKTGYTFGGWYKEPECTNKVTTLGETDYTSNITLYAQWTANTYTVQFNANDGTGTIDSQSFTYDVAQNLSANTYTRTGYNFTGWNTDADGTGTSYADKAEVKNLTAEPNGVVTLYAQWNAKPLTNYRTSCTYTVTWQANGGQWGDGKMEDIVQEYNVGEEINKPTDPTSDGYRFLGWSEDGTNIVKPESTMPAENLTYIAIWEKEYSVTYNPNGGNTTCVDNNAYIMGETVTVCATEPTKIGYTFAGWNDGTYTYQAGSQFSMPANNVTLTAQWTANTNTPYAVEHYQQNLDGTYPATPYETDALTGTTDATVTPSVKTYEGFTAPATQTVTILANGSLVVIYQYTRNSYQLTWDLNGGNETAAGTPAGSVKYGAELTAPQVEKEGYTFAGWEPVVPATMPAAKQTYTAQWDCAEPTDIKINGAYIVFPGETIELTVTGYNIADDATYQWYKKNGENYDALVGQTTNTLRIDNCVVGDAANYKCVVTNGACSAENNFTVKMYRLRGLTDPENSWTTDFVFSKAEGKTATYEITLNGESDYKFKVHDGSAYYGNNEGGDNQNPTMTHDNCTNWTMQENKGYNVILQTTITGVYTFVLDYTDESNPKISVIYPKKKMVYLNPGPWDVANAKFAVHTWIGENGADLFMEKVDDCTDRNIYQAEIDASHANIIFVRVNPANSDIQQLWNNVWNQTSDLTLPTDEKVMYDMTPLYLSPTAWDSDGAWFAAYFYNASGNTWRKMTDSDGNGIYECEKVAGYPNVIFCRMDPAKSDLAWGSVWNQTGDLTIPTQVNNHFIVPNNSAWNNPGNDGNWHNTGMWTTFTPYHTISYNMNGHGTQIEDNCIEDGDTWSAPNDPTAVGYTFLGWRRPAATGDSKLYKNGQTGYTPTASETLTAQWQINQCVVTWKVNAQEVAKTTVDITNPLTSIPHTPTDDELGCCAEKFIGWSTETNPTKNQVYTTASELQNLIGTLAANTTKTFHAVFATPVPGAGNSLVTFNEMGYANEEAVASVTLGDGMGNGDATITFNKGTAATYVPTYYNIGKAVRTYAGNTITVAATYANTVLTQIDFAFAKGENANAITASTGTITDGVWTGNAQSVTFTISGATGHRRIASIAITTAVTGDQYTNYVTKCDLSGSASIGAGTITYAVGNAIEVKCGQRSPASKAATLTFASAQDLTCPVTIEASAGFLVSTNKNDNSKYESNITVKPVKTGANKGKLPTIYVRAEANFGVSGQMNGTITASGDEITTTQVNVVANVTCTQYTLTVVDHLGNTISTTQYYEGDEVAEVDAPATDDCSKDYTFDGWSETSVEYGSLIYNKVSFPFTMPANDVTLYPVYVCSKDYHRVTEDLGIDNWEGQYLIAHSNTEFANGYQGGTTDGNCIGGTNSVRDLSQYITNDVVSKDCDIRSVKLIAVNGGYVLQTRDGKYNYITAGAQSGLTANDNLSTADDHPLTIIFNSETDIAITNLANVNQASLQYSATYFRFYKPGNQNPVYLYKKYLYTTPLICGTIEAEDAVVTSTAGQTIKVNVPITITSTLGGTTNITAESDNDHFAVTPLENVTTGEHTIAVHYTPDATTDGTEIANITLTASHGNRATTTFQVTGRHLPENFVIAAKWGENWYVLPADISSESISEGLLIEVDDSSDPTKALAAPNTTKYGLKSVYTTSGALDRYKAQGENIVFVENITGNNKTLYNAGGDAQNSTNTNIQVYAQYKTATGGYYETYPDRYEWIPTTTDLKDYTLTSAHTFATEAARTVSLDNHGIFGTLLQDKSYNGMVRLLPVDNFYETVELQVVEWKQNSVSVMYTGAGTKYTTQVGNNAESSVQPLSKIDHAVYSLSTGDLTTATNQPLIITIKNDADAIIGAVKLTIPAIVATDKSSTELSVTAENAKATNIVILDGATLTAGTTKYTYNDVVVYPGGNLVIDTDGKLGMYTLTLRAGSSWGAAEYEHKYPQFLLKGDYSNSSGQINLDYVTTQDYYYPLSVPEKVTIGDIKYPVDIYGSNVDKANSGSFQLKYYDGAQRVDQGSQYGTGWVVVDETKTQTLTPNQGYAIWGIPKKINGTRQTYGIHRIPIKKAASDLITNETTTEEIAITAHGDASTPPNDRGWNYLGNPYLAGLGTNDDTDVQMGLLVQEMIDGKWTGGWVNNGEQVRYVTLTNDCQNFEALPVSEATILPFTTFFVQAAQTGAIALNAPTAVAATASVVARRYAAQQETAKEITTGILLTGNDQTDRTGLLIADNFTEEYDYNADLSKFENSGINLYTIGKTGNLAYMAINQTLAEQPIPVGYTAPAEGLYTIAFDEDRYNATDISALYLIDYDSNEKTNLLHTDYSFVTAAGTNNQRFALQVAFAPENATNVEWVGDATIQVGVEGNTLMLNNLPTDAAVHVFDALGRLMYHAPTVPTEMQLTLPTGYYLVRIADKQNAVVIKTVIP